jgi:hypothetical protein
VWGLWNHEGCTWIRLSVMARPVWSRQWMMRARLWEASRHSASCPSLVRSKGTCHHEPARQDAGAGGSEKPSTRYIPSPYRLQTHRKALFEHVQWLHVL